VSTRHKILNGLGSGRVWLVGLPRLHKRITLVLNDLILFSLALWLALSFRHGTLYVPDQLSLFLVLATAPLLGVATFIWGGIYRVVTRYIGARGTSKVFMCIGLSVLLWGLVVLLSDMKSVPRSVIPLYFMLSSALIFASRHLAAWVLKGAGVVIPLEKSNANPVAIYGAGQTGLELLEALRRSGNNTVIGFLDNTPSLRGQYIGGVKVYPPEKLASMIERHAVKYVYLAQSLASRQVRAETLKWLEGFPVRVQVLPAINDLASGRVNVSALRAVEVDDLLMRDPAPPLADLLGRTIEGKSVLVTGAGGSIGSELVRKLVRLAPSRVVLFEMSEAALYNIDLEVRDILAKLMTGPGVTEIVAVLGSINDPVLVDDTIRRYEIQTICHAAAYKHVPLVEANVVAGLRNNVFGTVVLADAARRLGVERFILISSDKAVRPTNVMGASKRLAELILQAHAKDADCGTIFTIVRFGNVLDSSGSVMRRFRQQIATGGPVTVTHRDVIRYFMSIPEAVELVLQAAGLGEGGEVFVLEMGEPVRIDDLARSMIRLAGLSVREVPSPEGDIEIDYIGLRPGEKLFEELLIGGTWSKTVHPRILKSEEPFMTSDLLNAELQALRQAMDTNDPVSVQAVLTRVVEGYHGATSAKEDFAAGPSGALLWVPTSRTVH
jgi:FlaA1/EpsC-like NDP-sugar epimerase